MLKVRDACLSISLATSLFFSVYWILRGVTRIESNFYFLQRPLSSAPYLALIVNIVLTAAALFLLRQWTRQRSAPRLWWTIIGVVGLIAGVGLLRSAGWLDTQTATAVLATVRQWGWPARTTAILAAIAAAVLLFSFRHILLAAAAFGLVIVSPLSLLVIFDSAASAAAADDQKSAFMELSPLRSAPGLRPPPRLIVLVFDEADYRLMFVDRPRELALPELDRFRSESLFATNALPPASNTGLSLPALVSGTQFDEAKPHGPRELLLRSRATGKMQSWSTIPSIFSDFETLGRSVAIIGWFHPYGRLFRVRECRWYELPSQARAMGDSIAVGLIRQWRTLFETPRLSLFGQSLMTAQMVEVHRGIMRDSTRALSDPTLDLVFIHFAIPHSPHIYDLRKGTLTEHNSMYSGYIGNLALMDETFGIVRRALERTGDWNRSLVLLTSDHSCRYAARIDGKTDPRVPFIAKMPGQKEGQAYDRPFNTLAVRAMLNAVVRGETTSAADLAQWLDAKARPLPPL